MEVPILERMNLGRTLKKIVLAERRPLGAKNGVGLGRLGHQKALKVEATILKMMNLGHVLKMKIVGKTNSSMKTVFIIRWRGQTAEENENSWE